MNLEQTGGLNPELLYPRLTHARQVQMITAEWQAVDKASTYDKFMHELVDDLLVEDYKPVARQDHQGREVIFPHRPINLVTDTTIAVLRSTEPYPGRPEDLLLVYADLEHRRYGTMSVTEIIRSNDYTNTQIFLLSEPGPTAESRQVASAQSSLYGETVDDARNQYIDPYQVVRSGWQQACIA